MICSLFGMTKSDRGPAGPSIFKTHLALEALERRDVMSSISFIESSGTVVINGSKDVDIASVNFSSDDLTVDLATYKGTGNRQLLFQDSQTFNMSDVEKIVFVGGEGNDRFTNNSSEESNILGGGGNDVLTGGMHAERILGGSGNDTIHGGNGNDRISDSGGLNRLYGDGGHDRLFGGSGYDIIGGGPDKDTIVSIGGGKDTITGGPLNDYVWMDTIDVMTDISSAESGGKYIN